MTVEQLILIVSIGIAILAAFAAKNLYVVILYYLRKKDTTGKFLKLLSRINSPQSNKGVQNQEHSLFKLEGSDMDAFEQALAKLHSPSIIHIRKLIHFVGLSHQLSIKQFVFYSLVSGLIFHLLLQTFVPQLSALGTFGLAAPYLYLIYLKDQKIKTFVAYFPAALDSIAQNLRAGVDIIRAIKVVASDEKNFFAKDFKLILAEIELGVPVSEAFTNHAHKVGIPELELFAMGITLSMKVGSNLSDFVSKISETIRARIRLKGKVNSVTSESRTSLVIMCLAPFVIVGIQMLIDPVRYSGFLHTSFGQTLVIASVFSISLAVIWVNALMDIGDA